MVQSPAAAGGELAGEGEAHELVAKVRRIWAHGLGLPDASGSSLGGGSSLPTSDTSQGELVVSE